MPFDENSFVIFRTDSKECLIVDPGFEPQKIEAAVAENDLTPVAILCTHGHADHIAGNAYLKELLPDCPLIIGHEDASKLTDARENLSEGFGFQVLSPVADQTVREGDLLDLAGMQLRVREAPGHSSGHVVFILEECQPPIVIGGDVLFAGSIGRTDFPDGSFAELKSAIHKKLFILPDESIVLTGHGPATTIGDEKQMNPYVGLSAEG